MKKTQNKIKNFKVIKYYLKINKIINFKINKLKIKNTTKNQLINQNQ